MQFSTAGFLYMCALQLYYLLVIKYGWDEEQIRGVEKWFYLIPVLFGLATATAALVLQLYNPANWDCWIAPLDSTGGMDCTSSYESKSGVSSYSTTAVLSNWTQDQRFKIFWIDMLSLFAWCCIPR